MKRILYAAALLLCATQVQAQMPQLPRKDSVGGLNNSTAPHIGDTVANPIQRRSTPNTPVNPNQPGTPPVNTGQPVNSPGGTAISPNNAQR